MCRLWRCCGLSGWMCVVEVWSEAAWVYGKNVWCDSTGRCSWGAENNSKNSIGHRSLAKTFRTSFEECIATCLRPLHECYVAISKLWYCPYGSVCSGGAASISGINLNDNLIITGFCDCRANYPVPCVCRWRPKGGKNNEGGNNGFVPKLFLIVTYKTEFDSETC